MNLIIKRRAFTSVYQRLKANKHDVLLFSVGFIFSLLAVRVWPCVTGDGAQPATSLTSGWLEMNAWKKKEKESKYEERNSLRILCTGTIPHIDYLPEYELVGRV